MCTPNSMVYFLFGMKETSLNQLNNYHIRHFSRYRVRNVIPVKGEVPSNLAQCSNVVRIEASTPLSFPEKSEFPVSSTKFQFQGVTQHLQYTDDAQIKELNRRSISELEPSNHTTAVLIPVGKSEEWWKLAHDRRQVHFRNTDSGEGHTAIGLKYVDRVFRKLYHSHCLNTGLGYDFLTYFEFEDIYEKDFRTLLAELRDTKEWTFVNLEFEIWMTKIG
jgi:chlorite dismutase